jgi:hypothetical protein
VRNGASWARREVSNVRERLRGVVCGECKVLPARSSERSQENLRAKLGVLDVSVAAIEAGRVFGTLECFS